MIRLRFSGFAYAHLPEMTDLWVASWQASYPAIDFEARRAWGVDRFQALHAQGVAFVLAFDGTDGTMAGFLSVDGRTGHIDQVAVGTSYWGKGVADQLLEQAKSLSPHRLVLEVNLDNGAAIALYARHGFAKTGESVNPNSGRPIATMAWTPPAN
jgi:putative acetyltransferase